MNKFSSAVSVTDYLKSYRSIEHYRIIDKAWTPEKGFYSLIDDGNWKQVMVCKDCIYLFEHLVMGERVVIRRDKAICENCEVYKDFYPSYFPLRTGSTLTTRDWIFRWTDKKGFEAAFFPSMGCEGDFYKVLPTCQECPYILEHLVIAE